MEITKREDVTKQGFCKLPLLWRKLRLRGSLFIISVLIQFQSHCHPSGWGEGGRLFEAGRLLTFSAFRMGPYSRWALIRGWALFRINTVVVWWFRQVYRKIPKISPGASIFQRPYLRGLFLEVLLFGRAYLRRGWSTEEELEGNLPFLPCFTLYLRAISKYKSLGGLIFGGAISRRVFCVMRSGGLYMEGLIFGILR